MADPFSTLGLEPCFELDLRALEVRHRELSSALHPDRYVGRPSAERQIALGKAIEVNEARRALVDPVRRAEALLSLRGVELSEATEPKPSQRFLLEMMELREELAAHAKHKNLLMTETLREDVQARERGVTLQLTRAFKSLPADSAAAPSAEALAEIRAKLGELRYYRRLVEEARALEDQLG